MNRSLLTCLLAASIAAPTAFIAPTFVECSTHTPSLVTSISVAGQTGESTTVKPGKSKKYKKKMSKQMKKRKRH